MTEFLKIRRLAVLCVGVWCALSPQARASQTDIASAPLFTTSTTVVKPNVLFVLDDSGSMAWDYMPDDAKFGSSTYNSVYGRRAAQCNGLAFNPDEKEPYTPPVNAAGTSVGNASMDFLGGTKVTDINYLSSGDVNNTTGKISLNNPTSLSVVGSGSVSFKLNSGSANTYYNGMVVSLFGSSLDSRGRTVYSSAAYMIGKVTGWDSGTRTLTVAVAMSVGSGTINSVYVGTGSPIDNVYYTYSGSQTALDFVYDSSGLKTDTTFYGECDSAIAGGTSGRSVFTANIVVPGAAIAQRYANWYYYYSTRMRMMKTSLATAFASLDDKYRIGFTTINENTGGILDVADFGSTQKASFYSRVDGANPDNSTPLRAALSKAGLYYAKKISGQAYDPVQYSCQKNFTILSTDGYWNGDAGYKLDGSAMDQQDGGATPTPMNDGGNDTAKTVERWNVTSTLTRTTQTPYTKTDSETTTTKTPSDGYLTKTYTLGPLSTSFSNSGVSPSCSTNKGVTSCTVTVTTSSAHGYSNGTSITVSGVNPTVYNGTFTISVASATTYKYTLSGLSSVPSTPTSGNRGVSNYSPSSCPAGTGQLTETRTTYDQGTISISRVDTVSSYTETLVQTVTTTTPYTRTVTVYNGKQSSDVTTAGTPSSSTSTVSKTNSAVSTDKKSPAVSSGGTYTTTPVAAGSSISCAGSKTADSTTKTATTTQQTVTGPTKTTGSYAAGTKSTSDSTPNETVGAKTTTNSFSTTGSTDSLADVAMYYYQTDLRDSSQSNCTGALGTSVCENNVKALGKDTATAQHMSTYTLSLGMNGTLKYDPNYETQERGDFADLVGGNKKWPVPSDGGGAENIDDLWHAAVNGRGRYFSAKNPSTLAASLSAALNSIKAMAGSSSAAATSTLQPVEGDNGVFIAQFMSSEWTGDLRSYAMNVKTGAVPTTDGDGKDIATWSAGDKLTTAYARQIYYFKPGTGNAGTLRDFTYANLTADGMNGLVDGSCSKSPTLSQCTNASTTLLDSLNSGENMVSFLRGQAQSQYRVRAKVLGDIVNSSPVYVGKPGFSYTENGYASFKSGKAGRAPTLYVGANDGMLHAFNANDGTERWAYVPRLVMDRLYRLGDQYYESKHLYFVDATPTVGDVFVGGAWKTILVGGLNAGGSGYYALDITDPANPVALWEFTDTNMGLSYGNPVITKRKDGTWVVAFTSGHNNADGQGHLYVVDALTGAPLKDIATGVGSSGSPSGMSKLNAWIDADTDNLATRFYAGDLQGNIWRFDIDGVLEPKNSAFKLAQLLKDGVPQPITTSLQLAEIEANGGKHVVVYAGTGRYLGKTDVTDAQVQSVYAIKDALSSTGLGDVRSGGTLVKQEVDTVQTLRTVTDKNPVDWSTKNGWYLDLPDTRERVNVEMQLAFNMLTVAGNVPGNTATDCDKAQDGTSWIYQLNVVSGRGSAKALSSMVAGLSTVQLSDGTGVTVVTKTDATAPDPLTVPPSAQGGGKARRSSWRELVD